MRKYLAGFACVLLFLLPAVMHAYYAEPMMPENVTDYKVIENPTFKRAYYGELMGIPHTFEFAATEEFTLDVQILVPDIETAKNNMRGIVVREVTRGVREVARLRPQEAQWEEVHEPWGNDTYQAGPSHTETLKPGVYRIEVSNPDNEGKYVLWVGEEDADNRGYFEQVAAIVAVKQFFGKPAVFALASPVLYIPLSILIVLVVLAVLFIKRRRRQQGEMI